MDWFYIKKSLHNVIFCHIGEITLKQVLSSLLEDEANIVILFSPISKIGYARKIDLILAQLDNIENMKLKERFKALSLAEGLNVAYMEGTVKQQIDELYSPDSELYSPFGYSNVSSIGLDSSELFTDD